MSVNSQKLSQRGELYKQTLQTMRQGVNQPTADCPLNSPNIGLISENDHRTRNCLCPICTCGKHICPSKAIQDPYPSSIFNSHYMNNYQSRSPQRTEIPRNRGNFIPAVSFDFETTNEECYKPHAISVISGSPAKSSPLSPPRTAFCAKSSYATNFVNWGPGINQIVKPKPINHTSNEIKLRQNTSYRDNYSPIGHDDAISARPETVKKSGNTHIDPQAKFFKDTTNRKEFIDFSRVYNKEKGYKKDRLIPIMKSVDSHYVSTAKNDYKDTTNELDHRLLRKVIEKEGLIS